MNAVDLSSDKAPREIGKIIRNHQTFLIGGHVRPDGDVLGCQIALGLTLLALGKTVTIWNPDGMSHKYSFLPKSGLVKRPADQPQPFDVVMAVDTATQSRLGGVRGAIASRKLMVNLDHHASNERYGDVNWIEPHAAASGELVHRLLKENNWPITAEIAANLYVAISTDTGSFQYASTTPDTLRVAAELIEAGADAAELSRLSFESYPLGRLKLMQMMLGTLKLGSDDRIGSVWLTHDMYQMSGALPEDSEGLIDHVRAIDSVVVAVLFEEDKEGMVRLSLRSKNKKISVDRIAAKFGGGGHVAAAGARMKGEAAAVESAVLKAIREAVESVDD